MAANPLRSEGAELRSSWREVATAIGMVSGGLGVTVVPRLAFQSAQEGGIVAVPVRGPSISRTIGIVTRRGHTLSPLAESLSRAIRDYFASL